jgi:hypothetical protein
MTQRAYQLYQGCDWQTYRYSAAQVYDLLDQLRDATSVLLTGDVPPPFMAMSGFEPMGMLADLCSDLVGSVDMVLADLSATLASHLPSRWLMVELRTLVGQLPDFAQHCHEDREMLPALADRAERVRHLLQRLDS